MGTYFNPTCSYGFPYIIIKAMMLKIFHGNKLLLQLLLMPELGLFFKVVKLWNVKTFNAQNYKFIIIFSKSCIRIRENLFKSMQFISTANKILGKTRSSLLVAANKK